MVESADLPPLHGRTEEAGGLPRQGEPGFLDGPDAPVPIPAPLHEGVFLLVFLICHIPLPDFLPPLRFSGVIADEPDHPAAAGPDRLAAGVVPAELFLRHDFVLEGALFIAIGDGGEGTGAQAFLLQGEPLPIPGGVPHPGDGRHPVLRQPAAHGIQIGVGVGLLPAGIREEDEVHRDAPLPKSHQHGGAVRSSAVSHHVHPSPPTISACLWGGAWTSSRLRSAPHLNRQTPLLGELIRSYSALSSWRLSM